MKTNSFGFIVFWVKLHLSQPVSLRMGSTRAIKIFLSISRESSRETNRAVTCSATNILLECRTGLNDTQRNQVYMCVTAIRICTNEHINCRAAIFSEGRRTGVALGVGTGANLALAADRLNVALSTVFRSATVLSQSQTRSLMGLGGGASLMSLMTQYSQAKLIQGPIHDLMSFLQRNGHPPPTSPALFSHNKQCCCFIRFIKPGPTIRIGLLHQPPRVPPC